MTEPTALPAELTALLQLADAAFPAGAFAHSFGLETAVVEGAVRDEAALVAWLRAYLRGVFAPLDGAAFVLLARDAADAEALDDRLAAAQVNAELRRANAHLARATLATFEAIGLASARLARYRDAIARERCEGQHVLAAALGYDACGIPWRTALTAHAAATVATLASVAARAVPLGQRAIAHARWTLRPAIDGAVTRAAIVRDAGDLCTGAPAIEIDGLRHRRLNGRLFAS
ncbi:MAG: urease accessory protein UreF [Candidatus Eremiobacteraeota bacterium]|nr:urease accessory protein UreF [Candidatus Eremiobacteraeota bacterium]